MVTALNLIIIKYIVVERKYMRLKCLKNIYVGGCDDGSRLREKQRQFRRKRHRCN